MSDTPTGAAFAELVGQQALANADAAAITDAPPPAPAAPEQFPADVVTRLRNENAQWRQRAQALQNLDQADIAALDPLLAAMRAGDTDAVGAWIESQHTSWTAANGRGPAPAADPGAPPMGEQPLTADQLNRLLDERDRRQAQQTAKATSVATLNEEFRAAGIEPTSPWARAVAAEGLKLSQERGYGVPVAEALQSLRGQLPPAFGGGAPAPAGGPGGLPAAPAGSAGVDDRWAKMSPTERMRARLSAANPQ